MKHFRYYVRLLFLLFSVNGITKNSRCGFMGIWKETSNFADVRYKP